MSAAAILLFLTGAVLAWRFRVWILLPVAFVSAVVATTIELSSGLNLSSSLGAGLFAGTVPQFGYAFGLIGRQTLGALRKPLARHPSRKSIAVLYRSHQAK